MSKRKEGFCIIAGCTRKVRSRGLCGACYLTARNYVLTENVSWEELHRRGLCLASELTRKNPFAAAWQKSNEKQDK